MGNGAMPTPLMSGIPPQGLFDAGNPATSGGFARVTTSDIVDSSGMAAGTVMAGTGVTFDTDGQLQLDSTPATLSIISTAAIGGLLGNPATTRLLDDNSVLNYGAWSSATPANAMTGMAASTRNITARGPSGQTQTQSGVLHVQPTTTADSSGTTNIYIDDHAAVVLSSEVGSPFDRLELTAIGAPFSRMPNTLDVFSGTYSGYAVVITSVQDAAVLDGQGIFDMQVAFDTSAMTSSITTFTAEFTSSSGAAGSVSASNIPIDNDHGTFAGTAAFDAIDAARMAREVILTDDMNGRLFGQFHGENAAGVTGAFHNSDNSVLGGFAGSKE